MTRINNELLHDTLNVVALAREAARARGGDDQAERLSPMEEGLRKVVSNRNQKVREASSGALARDDFKALLAAVQSEPLNDGVTQQVDRNEIAAAMAAGGMNEIDIARHLGISQERVRVILDLHQGRTAGERVS